MSSRDGRSVVTKAAYSDRAIPCITYGQPFHTLIAHHLSTTYSYLSRIYVLASTSLAKNHPDCINDLRLAIGSEKLLGVHTGVAPHTHWDDLLSIANILQPLKPDCIITLGAGSLTDAAKILAWMLANSILDTAGLETLWAGSPTQRHDLNPSEVITIAVPTSLSGGEYQRLAGGTKSDGSKQKCPFYPPEKNPALVVLDAELVTKTPERVWLSTGFRSVDHCVETLCSLRSNEAGDRAAERGLTRLVGGLLRTKHDPDGTDLDARFECQLGVIDAMSAVGSGVPLGGSHAIGHQLGPMGVPHGETSCVCLPAVCRWTAEHGSSDVLARQEKCKAVVVRDGAVQRLISNHGLDEDEVDLCSVLELILTALDMPMTLKDVGIEKDKLDLLAKNTLADIWAATNAVALTEKGQVLEILDMVVG